MQEVERKRENIDTGVIGGAKIDNELKKGLLLQENKNKDLYLGFV